MSFLCIINNMRKRYLKGIIIILTIILLDQVSKFLISKFFYDGESLTIIKNFFYLTYHKNLGAAFGIFQGSILFLICISIVILVYLIREMKKSSSNKLIFYSFIILIGGLIGNLIDRVFFGYVRDFLEFKIFNYNAPIFNISDICITIGVFALIIFIFMEETDGSKDKQRR